MVRCPRCTSANLDRTLLCGRCSEFLPGGGAGRDLPMPQALSAASSKVELWPSKEARGENGPAAPPLGRPARATTPPRPTDPSAPMVANESVAQAVNATIPATDRADKPPPPPAEQGVRPRLVVLRGMRIGVEYPIYEGRNTVGRFADKPVDIDLISQESPEQIWCSRRHATFTLDNGVVAVEDLNSLNGTWVNGARILPGQPRQLQPGDVVQVGTVQMKLVVG